MDERLNGLDLRHLDLLLAVADEGTLTAAGRRLNLSQSALSHRLRDAERALRLPLFRRGHRRMTPTPSGTRWIEAARRVRAEIESAARDSAARSAEASDIVRIATQCYTCYHWLPGLLKEYRLRHPHVDVHVDADATPRPIKSLLDGRIDLAIVSDRVRDRRLVERPLFEDEVLVIMAPTHRLAARTYVEPHDFADETLIIYPPKEESTMLQRVLGPAGVTPKALQQVQLSEAIVELVKAGLGVSTMARWAIEPYVRAGAIRTAKLTRKGFKRRWSAVLLRDMAGAAFAKDFIDLIVRRSPVAAAPHASDTPRRARA
jgi:LysR family transcriptional regulator for metE and metH